MFYIKPGAKIKGIQPEILIGLHIVEEVINSLGYDTTLTEATGGKHMPDSLHYKGLAVDIRSKDISLSTTKANVIKYAKSSLGDEFDFILEDEGAPNEHFHLEFDPKI